MERIKFECERSGAMIPDDRKAEELLTLAKFLETENLAPILDDGKISGNAATTASSGILITKSGRDENSHSIEDIVYLTRFDEQEWKAKYYSMDDSIQPSSDAPLHYLVLKMAADRAGWKNLPLYSIHGHALSTDEDAKKLNLPISLAKTEFSTREDYQALLSLLAEYPYPEYKTWIRRGHGFVTVGASLEEIIAEAEKLVKAASV